MEFAKFCSIKSHCFLYEIIDFSGQEGILLHAEHCIIQQLHPRIMLYLFY